MPIFAMTSHPSLAHQPSYHLPGAPSTNPTASDLPSAFSSSTATAPAAATADSGHVRATRPEIARAVHAVRVAVDAVPDRLRKGHDARQVYHDVQVAIARLAKVSGVEYKERGAGVPGAGSSKARDAGLLGGRSRRSGPGQAGGSTQLLSPEAPRVPVSAEAGQMDRSARTVPPITTKLVSETAVEITIPTLLTAQLTLSPTSGLISALTLQAPPRPATGSARSAWPCMQTSIVDRIQHTAISSLQGRSVPEALAWAASCAKLYLEPCCVCGQLLKVEQVREGALWQQAAKQLTEKQVQQQASILGRPAPSSSTTRGDNDLAAPDAGASTVQSLEVDRRPSIDAGVLAPPTVRWAEAVGPTAVHESCLWMAGQQEEANAVRAISI